jgi:gamma-glutamyl hercynylcysteine S-oxide synthase
MYCVACNLHYPDHLSFCRRCGQALARSANEAPVESACCTRCGARVVRGEKFCQHCGFRFGVAGPETVIGACYHCGTSWRTGWLFCKNCGLDRDRALLLSTSTPFAASAPLKKSGAPEELPEAVKVRCKHCGAEAKPYSRFCEACGRSINNTDALTPPTTSANAATPPQVESPPSPHPTEADKPARPAPPAAPPLPATPASSSRPTLIDAPIVPPPVVAPAPPIIVPMNATRNEAVEEKKIASGAASATITADNEPAPVAQSRPLVSNEDKPHISHRLPANYTPADNLPISRGTATIQPPEVSAAGLILAPEDEDEGWGAARPVIAVAALLLLLLSAVAAWWLLRNTTQETARKSVTPLPQASPAQSSSPAPLAATPQASPSAATAVADMVLISGGQFMMGRNGGDEFESPTRAVTVRPFYLDRTEVTNEEYQKFIEATNRRAPAHWKNGKFPAEQAKFPVVNVTWNDARAYAKWAKKRLPSEAEWEFAARGTDGRVYPWGNDWRPGFANADHAQGGQISEVGRYPNGATPQGILDMCGNVWEWTASALVSYADGKKELARGKVIRGGAFDGPRDRVTMTYRGVLPADAARDKTGFRCARDAQ